MDILGTTIQTTTRKFLESFCKGPGQMYMEDGGRGGGISINYLWNVE